MFKGLGDMGDLSKMMEAAQQMQTRMAEMQEGLTRLTVTGEAGAGLVKQAQHAMNTLKDNVVDVQRMIAEISRACSEQALSLGEVSSAVRQLDDMTQQNAALVEQSTAAACSLEEQATKLAATIARFNG